MIVLTKSMKHRIVTLAASTLGVMLLTIGSGTTLSIWMYVPADLHNQGFIISVGLSLLGVLVILACASIVGCILAPFDHTVEWRGRAWLVIVGYVVMILSYSGVYFFVAGLSDYDQAFSANMHFQSVPEYRGLRWDNMSREDLITHMAEHVANKRAFNGMGRPLYLAIHEEPSGRYGERTGLSGTDIIKLAAARDAERPRVDLGVAWGLWWDCLHYSIVTAATVGYGDIIPISRLGKLVSDSQILASAAILVFGFAFVMSERPKEKADGQQ